MIQEEKHLLDSDFLHQLERLALINKRVKKGLYSGKRRSQNQGSSIEFADYRSYNPGDDFRQIDWNAYARHEKLFLKTFLDEQELHISIYIDCSKSMEFGEPSKFQSALKIAAALGYLSLYHFDRVYVYGFNNTVNAALPALFGKGKTHQLFRFLESLKTSGEGNLNQSLASGKAVHGKPGISIIISDFLYEDGYEKGIGFIQAANQEVILVHLLAEEERNPVLDGDLRLVDSESKLNKEVSISPYLLNEYQKTLNSFKQDLSNFAYKRGIAYLRVDSEISIEQIIFNVFKQSGLIR